MAFKSSPRCYRTVMGRSEVFVMTHPALVAMARQAAPVFAAPEKATPPAWSSPWV